MKNPRALFLACLLAGVLCLTGCRYITNFVVINGSNQPVEVWYILKKPAYAVPPDQSLRMAPAVRPISEMHQQTAWRDLSASEYTFDPGKRKVTVSLEPGQALLIEQCAQVGREVDDAQQAEEFSIEEIAITGANGEIKLHGEQARKSFLAESKNTHTLTYH